MQAVHTPCFSRAVSFQITKPGNVESIYYRKKIFMGILDHENIL